MSGSGATAHNVDDEDVSGGAGAEVDVETRARRQGWKSEDEFKGDRSLWRPADEYLARAEEEMPVLRERYRKMETQLNRVLGEAGQTRQVVLDMTEQLRRSEERAYKRARKDLEEQRTQAVSVGDTEVFHRVEREIADLDQDSKPAAGARRGHGTEQEPAATAGRGMEPPPVVRAWGARNPWFQQDAGLQTMATNIHTRLLQDEPALSLEENLERVTAVMAQMYPDRVSAPRGRRAVADEDVGGGGDDGAETAARGNPRRQQAAAVSPSRERGERRRGGGRSFDAMPADAKASYARYAKMIGDKDIGKVKPLTKDEFAKDYWDQFEE